VTPPPRVSYDRAPLSALLPLLRRAALIAAASAGLLAAAGIAGAQERRSPALQALLREPAAARAPIVAWVFFRDKGSEARLLAARSPITPRAASRRRVRGGAPLASFADLLLEPDYVTAVASRVIRIRHASRWFNAVSVEATAEQLEALEGLDFISRLDLVRRYRRSRVEPERPGPASAGSVSHAGARTTDVDYGTSLGQLAQINVPPVHQLGLHGEGVVIAIFDAGFDNLAHESFSSMSMLARHDFVNGDEDVGNGSDRGEGSHGTATLSVLGGLKEGQLVGPAFGASYLLAKTEDTDSETPVEEDNWAAAAEWAEALGADIISTSLGYLEFDPGFPSYTFQDMDGEHAISSRAASLAAERGVLVVVSAGNAGPSLLHNTLGAPADAKRVLSVAAVEPGGVRAPFSSVGPTVDGRIKPDVAAQGVLVKLAGSGAPDSYRFGNGTSFACPLTAGVAALVLQAHPTYTVDQLIAVLHGTASQASAPDNLLGWGIVNAVAAVQAEGP
jgi:serine protease AprX